MSISRKNHFLPKMYLDGWAHNELICTYDLLAPNENMPIWSKPKPLSSVAYMNNIYVGIMSDEEFDDLEHEFNERFETPAKEPLEKIRDGQKLKNEEWSIISDFIAAQYVRVPAFYHRTHDLEIACAENVLNNLPPITKETLTRHRFKNPTANEDAKEFIPLSIELTDDKTPNGDSILKIDTLVGKGFWLYTIKHFLNEKSAVRAHFQKIKWSICKVATGIVWPTCDNPFAILNAKSDNSGLMDRNNVFIFPISPTLVLVGKNANRWPWRLELSTEQSAEIRNSIVFSAERYIYNPFPDATIPKIRPRIVNEDEYKRQKQMYDSWHDVYKEKEGPMLNTNHQIKGWPKQNDC